MPSFKSNDLNPICLSQISSHRLNSVIHSTNHNSLHPIEIEEKGINLKVIGKANTLMPENQISSLRILNVISSISKEEMENTKMMEQEIEEDFLKDDLDHRKIGMKNIKLYEITLLFLFFKKRIYEFLKDKCILTNKSNKLKKDQFRKKLTLNQVLDVENENFDVFNIEGYIPHGGMATASSKIRKSKSQIHLNLEKIEQNLFKLDEDIKMIQQVNFDLFDHIKISSIFENNFSSFVVKEKTKSMNHFF